MNLRNLERVLAREEEVKKRAIVHKAVYTGPQVRYFSKDGKLSALQYSDLFIFFFEKYILLAYTNLIIVAISFSDKEISKLHFFRLLISGIQ